MDFPDPLSPPVYCPSLPGGLQDYILYQHSCHIYILASRPAFACPCDGVYRSILLMSLSLFLHEYSACLVRLTLIVFVIGGKWPYSCCFVGCCLQDLFNTARSILRYLLSSFFSIYLVTVHVVHPYSSIDMTATALNYWFFWMMIW